MFVVVCPSHYSRAHEDSGCAAAAARRYFGEKWWSREGKHLEQKGLWDGFARQKWSFAGNVRGQYSCHRVLTGGTSLSYSSTLLLYMHREHKPLMRTDQHIVYKQTMQDVPCSQALFMSAFLRQSCAALFARKIRYSTIGGRQGCRESYRKRARLLTGKRRGHDNSNSAPKHGRRERI